MPAAALRGPEASYTIVLAYVQVRPGRFDRQVFRWAGITVIVAGLINTPLFSVVTVKEIARPEDLRGKKIGITRKFITTWKPSISKLTSRSLRITGSSSTTRIAAMRIDPCETEARRNRREITWLGSSGTHKMPKSVNTLVGRRLGNWTTWPFAE